MDIVKKLLKILALGGLVCLVLYVAFVALMMYLLSYKGYHGERKDLYSVAVNNVFGIYGRHSNGEVSFDPKIYIIETDEYGRTLYFYNEYYDYSVKAKCDYGMAFVIMQGSNEEYAYYYPDKCYLPYFDTEGDWNNISAKLPPDFFDALKEANDWNQELQEEKCAKVKISKKKPKGNLKIKDNTFDQIIYRYELANGYTGLDSTFYRFNLFSEADCSGKELYFVYGTTCNRSSSGVDVYDQYEYAIIFNADGTCSEEGIVKISSPEDSVDAIRELKRNNNWNLAG